MSNESRVGPILEGDWRMNEDGLGSEFGRPASHFLRVLDDLRGGTRGAPGCPPMPSELSAAEEFPAGAQNQVA
jgi:hypothetical protein